MRSLGVVEPSPSLDDDTGLTQRAEPFAAQAFVSEFAVEAFAFAVLPRLSGSDKQGLDIVRLEPIADRLSDKFAAVVGSDRLRETPLQTDSFEYLPDL